MANRRITVGGGSNKPADKKPTNKKPTTVSVKRKPCNCGR